VKLNNRNIVVTGSSGGIGWAFAEACARNKNHLILVQRKSLGTEVDSLIKLGALSVQLILADLSNRQEVQKVSDELKTKNIDVLFNNAGLLTGGLLEEQPLDDIHKMLEVNVHALIHLTHQIVPQMVRQKSGYIINHASVSAVMHMPCASTYAASKAAVWAFTDCLQQELKSTGVETLCLFTPGIKTKMFDQIDDLYSKNMKVPQDSISPESYAKKIVQAVENRQNYLEPTGATGIAFFTATHFKSVFNWGLSKAFKGR